MSNKISHSEFSEKLFATLRDSAPSRALIVRSDKTALLELFNAMARTCDRIVQAPSRELDEDGMAVGFMKAKDLALAVMSAQVPTAAGSPVGILLSQDNLSALRRMSSHYPSILVVEFSGDESAPDMNILSQFLELKKIKDIDLSGVALLLTGDLRSFPGNRLNKIEAFELISEQSHRCSTPSPR